MQQKRPLGAHLEPLSRSGEGPLAGESSARGATTKARSSNGGRRRKLPRNVRVLAENLSARSKGSFDFADESTPAPVEVEARIPEARSQPRAIRGSKERPRWTKALMALVLGTALILGLTHAKSDVPTFASRTLNKVAALVSVRNATSSALGFSLPFGNSDAPAIQSEKPITTDSELSTTRSPVNREGHVSINGGILVLPSTFVPDADGAYDLLLHFHGNTAVVKESAEVSKLNAAVAIVNLGIGSLPYEEAYAVPGTYEELLASIERGLVSRGVQNAHLRRVALSSWSAGYGAISTILQVRRKTEELDAVLIFDGIHCGWEGGTLNARQMHPWVDIAKRAVNDELYFGITHSSIDPRLYASTTATSSYLLDAVGVARETRDPVRDAPHYLELASMNGAIAKKLEKVMEPISEAHKGSFHVIGYKGETPEHHMEHLFQMGATLLPELVARWSR